MSIIKVGLDLKMPFKFAMCANDCHNFYLLYIVFTIVPFVGYKYMDIYLIHQGKFENLLIKFIEVKV